MNLEKDTKMNTITKEKELVNEKQQTNFIETTLGKTVNFGLDIGLRAILPDIIENQIIDIKDTLLEEGFSEGIKKVVSSAVDFGKSAIGIVTGKFENLSQVQNAIKNGGIIDGISNLFDFVLNKTSKKGIIPYGISKTIRQGKNVILNSITNNIETEFNKQLDNIEKLQKYENNWKECFNSKDFNGMKIEYDKIEERLKDLIPIENTLKEARIIENLHTLIKNNGQDFNLSKEEMQLADLLT